MSVKFLAEGSTNKQEFVISQEKANLGDRVVTLASDLYADISVRIAGVIKPIIYLGGAIAKLAIMAAIKLPIAFIATPIVTMVSIYVDNQREKLQSDLENIKKHEETAKKFINETNELQTDITNFITRLNEKKIKLQALKSEIEEGLHDIKILEEHRDVIKKRESQFKQEIQGTDFETMLNNYERPAIRGAKQALEKALQKKYPIEFARASNISRSRSNLDKISKRLRELEGKNSELKKNLQKIENEIAGNETHLLHFKNDLNSRLKTREPIESTSKRLNEIQKNTKSNLKDALFLIKSLTSNTFAGLEKDFEMIGSYFGGQTANALTETVSGTANKKPISALDAFSDTLSILAGDYHDTQISPERETKIKSVYKTEAARQNALAEERISSWQKERGIEDPHMAFVTDLKEELAEKFTEQELKILCMKNPNPELPNNEINTERFRLQLNLVKLHQNFMRSTKFTSVEMKNYYAKLDEKDFVKAMKNHKKFDLAQQAEDLLLKIERLDVYASTKEKAFEKYNSLFASEEFERKIDQLYLIKKENSSVMSEFSESQKILLEPALIKAEKRYNFQIEV